MTTRTVTPEAAALRVKLTELLAELKKLGREGLIGFSDAYTKTAETRLQLTGDGWVYILNTTYRRLNANRYTSAKQLQECIDVLEKWRDEAKMVAAIMTLHLKNPDGSITLVAELTSAHLTYGRVIRLLKTLAMHGVTVRFAL